MKRQIQRFREQYHLTEPGITKTIEYCFRFRDPVLEPSFEYGIGFVPSYYDEAKQFYERVGANKKAMDDAVQKHETEPERTIFIYDEDRDKPNRKRRPLIDIGSLEVGDGN